MEGIGMKQFKKGTLSEFYAWQGTDEDPAPGTVNHTLGYSTANLREGGNKTVRYSRPLPHPSQEVVRDVRGMPSNITPKRNTAMENAGITTNHSDVIWVIDDNCPPDDMPSDLIDQEEAKRQGWCRDLEEEGII